MLASLFHHLFGEIFSLAHTLCVVACSHPTHLVWSVCGLWSVVHGHEQGGASTIFINGTALHVFLRVSSLPLRVVLFVRGRLLLSETEAPSLAQNEQRTEAFSLGRHRPLLLGTYIIVALRGCGTTYITQHVSLRLGQLFCSYDHVSCV